MEGRAVFLEEVASKLRPGGGRGPPGKHVEDGFPGEASLFGDLRTGPCGWCDQCEGAGRW